ncbi:MAG: AAA family ATPase [Candidatus Thorarchaeota archaeon]
MVDLDEMVRDLLGEKKEEREEKKEETVEEVLGEQQEQQVEQIGAEALKKVEERVSSESEQILEQRTLNIGGYDIELDESEQKLVFLIAGEKGAGKTTLAFAFDGVKLCIPFDTKSFVVKRTLYNNDSNIIIASCLKYLANAVVFEQITEASARFYDCIVKLLEHILQNNSEFQGRKIDWVILDNFENFSRIAEYTARFHNKLQAFDTPQKDIFFKIWGERNWYIRNIFNLTYHIARKGVIYTVYLTEREEIVNGEVRQRRKEPAWVDAVKYETDIALKIERKERRYLVEVLTSKYDDIIPNDAIIDVTDVFKSAGGFFALLRDKSRVALPKMV